MAAPRIAVIGAGNLSRRYHLPSFAELQRKRRCVLAALCDLDEARAAEAARAFGARRVYTDVETMLRAERPDGVAVIVPVQHTRRVAGMVLKKGYPTLTEKPPGLTPAECKGLIRDAKAGRAPNMVAFNRRQCPMLVQAREEVLKRGPLKGANGRMYRHRRVDPAFWTTFIHSVDALRFLGGEIDRVVVDRRTLHGDKRPAFTCAIEYAGGGLGTLSVRPEAGASVERYELFGKECTAFARAGVGWLADGKGLCELYDAGKRVPLPDPLKPYARFQGNLLEAAVGGFYGEDAAFVEAVRAGKGYGPSLAESLPSVEICMAVQAGRGWRRNVKRKT
ncbi:MAG: Gfo/Idh/MocA family oxidoreductase [Planctomycetota bacterium]|nr:Gfo/Idh/MocA family oxidoreductase [Planctomycetota bacterium]